MKLHLKRKWRKTKAFAKKDLKGMFRFKLGIFSMILTPFLTMASILITYSAVFFGTGVTDLGFVNKSNYVIYLVTGFLVYTVFRLAWGRTSLNGEKIMQTLDGVLLAPGSRIYILLSKGLIAFIDIGLAALAFGVILFLLRPQVIWLNFFVGLAALFFVFVIFISFDFILTAIGLFNEGIAGLMVSYLPKGFLLIGCVYYPITIIPEPFRILVYLNPLFYGTNLFRSAFMNVDLSFGIWGPFISLFIFAATLPFISVKVFEYILDKKGVRGY